MNNELKRINKKLLLISMIGAACVYILNKKIEDQAATIRKLSEELDSQKGE